MRRFGDQNQGDNAKRDSEAAAKGAASEYRKHWTWRGGDSNYGAAINSAT